MEKKVPKVGEEVLAFRPLKNAGSLGPHDPEWEGGMRCRVTKVMTEPDGGGYPRVTYKGKRMKAARALWLMVRGRLRRGQCVLHRCDNPACVNIEHLFKGTQRRNNKDRDKKGRNATAANGRHANSKKTHCPRGHKYTKRTTYQNARGQRYCRLCKQIHKRNYRARRRIKL